MITKIELRQKMKLELEQIDLDTYNLWSNQIAEQLFQTELWKNAKTIGVTISRGKEVNTFSIIEKAWEQGKKICVPKCYPKEKKMEFRQIRSFDQLEIVYYGLQEPIVKETELVDNREIDFLIVPGICFSKDGFRLGYGGGYYDRYLTNFHGSTVSLAFPVQIVEEIPREPHDIPVKYIVTTDRVIDCYEL
jgi:5-formyltetrahydrofolate cyclo-ligase